MQALGAFGLVARDPFSDGFRADAEGRWPPPFGV